MLKKPMTTEELFNKIQKILKEKGNRIANKSSENIFFSLYKSEAVCYNHKYFLSD